MNEEVITILTAIASTQTYVEKSDANQDYHFSPDDWFGGNADDIFNGGLCDGEIYLARRVLNMVDVEYW